jgi:hypothetical protein
MLCTFQNWNLAMAKKDSRHPKQDPAMAKIVSTYKGVSINFLNPV